MESTAEQQLQLASRSAPPAQPPQLPRRRLNLGLILLIPSLVLLVGGFLAVAGASVYANVSFPFISTKQRQNLAKLFYKVPLLPKTAEQILLAASEENFKLTTYSPEFSMSANLGATGIGAGALDLKIKGPVDFSPGKKVSFDLSIDVGVNFAGKSYQGSGKVRKKEDTVFGKVDKVSDSVLDLYTSFSSANPTSSGSAQEIRKNLESVFQNWFSYDTKGIESEARKTLESRGGQQSLIDTTRRKTQEFLLDSAVLPEVKKLADENIDKVATFHLQLIPSKALLRKVFVEVLTQNNSLSAEMQTNIDDILETIESAQIDVWFGQSDALLRRLSLQTQVKLEMLTRYFGSSLSTVPGNPFSAVGSLVAPKLSLSTVLTIRDIGKTVSVDTPTPVKTSEGYLKLLSEASKTQEQKEQAAKQTQYDQDFRDLQGALLKRYAEASEYPPSLDSLLGKEITATTPLGQRLSQYSYRVSPDKKNYLVYVVFSLPYRYADVTPFYGITSLNSYPHQLTKRDFDFQY